MSEDELAARAQVVHQDPRRRGQFPAALRRAAQSGGGAVERARDAARRHPGGRDHAELSRTARADLPHRHARPGERRAQAQIRAAGARHECRHSAPPNPALPMASVCRAINTVLEAEGYGEYCHPPHIRRRGHGLGFGSIRPGDVSLDNDTVLTEGMVFMIHPNQHLPETGYLLCGEPVLLTARGAEPLTQQPVRAGRDRSLRLRVMLAMNPTLLVGPADWDAARMPKAEFVARAGALWRDHPVGDRRHRLRRPGEPRRARLSHQFHAQARSGAGADPARWHAAAPGGRRRQHVAGGKAADLHRGPATAAQCRQDGRRMGA